MGLTSCPDCAATLSEGYSYCPHCGKPLRITCLVSNPPTMACLYCRDTSRCPHGVKKNA